MKKVLFAIQVITISFSLPAYIIIELGHDDRGYHVRYQQLQVSQSAGLNKSTASVEVLSTNVRF